MHASSPLLTAESKRCRCFLAGCSRGGCCQNLHLCQIRASNVQKDALQKLLPPTRWFLHRRFRFLLFFAPFVATQSKRSCVLTRSGVFCCVSMFSCGLRF